MVGSLAPGNKSIGISRSDKSSSSFSVGKDVYFEESYPYRFYKVLKSSQHLLRA